MPHLLRVSIFRRLRHKEETNPLCDDPRYRIQDIFRAPDVGDPSTWEKQFDIEKNIGALTHFWWIVVTGLAVADSQSLLEHEKIDGLSVRAPWRVRRVCNRVIDPVKLKQRRPDLIGKINRGIDPTEKVNPPGFIRITRDDLMLCLRDRMTEPLSDVERDSQLPDGIRPTEDSTSSTPTVVTEK